LVTTLTISGVLRLTVAATVVKAMEGAMITWPVVARNASVAWDTTAAAMDVVPVMHLWFVGVRGSCRSYHPCDAPLVGAVAGVGVGLFAPDAAVLCRVTRERWWGTVASGECRLTAPCEAPVVGAVAVGGSDSLAHLFPMSPAMTTLVPSYVGCVPDPAAWSVLGVLTRLTAPSSVVIM
jgi:hypothetical protein